MPRKKLSIKFNAGEIIIYCIIITIGNGDILLYLHIAAGELPHTKNILLTYDEEDSIVYNSVEITIMPVWKWLLGIED